jgi:hypothetical protein
MLPEPWEWEGDEELDESLPVSIPGISCRGKFMLIISIMLVI